MALRTAFAETGRQRRSGFPALFVKRNICFRESGEEPIHALDGGHVMSAEEARVHEACMKREPANTPGAFAAQEEQSDG